MDKEIKKVIVDHVEKTFSRLFGVRVHPASDFLSSFNDDDLVTKVEMKQPGMNIIIRFVFPRNLLKPLLLQLYLPAMATHEMAYEDAACEIVNIVCNGLKTYLNESGYALKMEIPKIDYSNIGKSSDDKPDHLNINFILKDDRFSIDMVMSEELTQDEQDKKI